MPTPPTTCNAPVVVDIELVVVVIVVIPAILTVPSTPNCAPGVNVLIPTPLVVNVRTLGTVAVFVATP